GEMRGRGSDAGKLPSGVSTVGLAFDSATRGYWLLTSDGAVGGFGAPDDGSLKGKLGGTRPEAIASSGSGYVILTANGGVHPFGGATWHGSDVGKLPSGVHAVALAILRKTGGYW